MIPEITVFHGSTVSFAAYLLSRLILIYINKKSNRKDCF